MERVFNAPIITNDQSFDRLLAAQTPVLFLFWDGQSLPDDLNQVLLDLAREEAGKLIIAKVNASENPKAARHFNVERTPVLIGLNGGKEITRVVAPTASEVREHVQFLLNRAPRPTAQPRRQATRQKQSAPGTAAARPVHATDATFEQEVLRSPLPVIVDFWAPWCGPCHMIAPTLEKLAREYAGRLRIVKVNVDENPHYAGVYGVQGIPTLLMVNRGQAIDRLVGALPEPQLRAQVERFLAMVEK
ncbi:MAG TPA: thioredoxin [Chloroflexi bacterium]|nr:thioredoxin [Chloroflexota bacterium]